MRKLIEEMDVSEIRKSEWGELKLRYLQLGDKLRSIEREPLASVDWDKYFVIGKAIQSIKNGRIGVKYLGGRGFVVQDKIEIGVNVSGYDVVIPCEYGSFDGKDVLVIGALFDDVESSKKKLWLSPVTYDGLQVLPIKTVSQPGFVNIGVRFKRGDVKLAVFPFPTKIGRRELNLIQDSVLFFVAETEDEVDAISWILDQDVAKSVYVCGADVRGAKRLGKGEVVYVGLQKCLPMYYVVGSQVEPKFVNCFMPFYFGTEDYMLGMCRVDSDGEVVPLFEFDDKIPIRISCDDKGLIPLTCVEFAKYSWGLCRPYYRLFEFSDLSSIPFFNSSDKVIVEAKFDGVRAKVIANKDSVKILTDPDETSTPDKTSRLPVQVKELKSMQLPDVEFDCEVVAIKDDEVKHRTVVNSLLNGKFDPSEECEIAHLFVFDILQYEGKSTKNYPLKERKELLSKFVDRDHIHFVRTSANLEKNALSYLVKSDVELVERVSKRIVGSKPKFIAEGVMVKDPNGTYDVPQNKGWAKWKMKFEIDALVVGKEQIKVKGKPISAWNYLIAIGPISEEYAKDILAEDSKAVVEFEGKYYNLLGKTDNTSIDVKVGSILRVAAEDVNRFETKDPLHPYFKTYVAVPISPVPEKGEPDRIDVALRLSTLTPSRMKLASKYGEIKRRALELGEIPKDDYKELAKENEPLPPDFYNDYRQGEGWIQAHIRGIKVEEYEDFKANKKDLADVLLNHSIHLDFRIAFNGLKSLVQWVITDNDAGKLLQTLRGDLRETKGGQNVAHSLAIVKPSAIERVLKGDIKEPSLSQDDVEELVKYIIESGSYWIEPGDVGATSYSYAYMALIWKGEVKAGVQRKDFHEYFLKPKGVPKLNSEIYGKYVVKCLNGKDKRWEFWKAKTEPLPADPILHKDSGYYYPVPEDEIKALGREHYKYGVKEEQA